METVEAVPPSKLCSGKENKEAVAALFSGVGAALGEEHESCEFLGACDDIDASIQLYFLPGYACRSLVALGNGRLYFTV